MEIYLMQHGEALLKEQDPEEGLSPKGMSTIYASAVALRKMGIHFDLIVASPKKRSKETALIIAKELDYPSQDIAETTKVKAMIPPEETIEWLHSKEGKKHILIAGHLPGIANIASYLLTGEPGELVEFSNGCCCKIAEGRLVWCLTPEQLALI